MDDRLEHELPFGERPDGRLVSVGEVERGEACDCVCPDCRRTFIAAQGTKRAWYFRHKAVPGQPSTCEGYYETALHKLAKQALGETNRLWLSAQIPRYLHHKDPPLRREGWVAISNVRTEVRIGSIVADAVVEVEGRDLVVEILVTHQCTPEKLTYLREHEIPAIEIDLSTARMMEPDLVVPHILGEAPRSWLSAPGLAAATAKLKANIEAWLAAQRERQAEIIRSREAQEAAWLEQLEVQRRREQERQEAEAKRQADQKAEWRRRYQTQIEENEKREQAKREALEERRKALPAVAEAYYPSRTTPAPMDLEGLTFGHQTLVELFDGTQSVQAHLALIDQEPIRKAVENSLRSNHPEIQAAVKDAISRSWARHH